MRRYWTALSATIVAFTGTIGAADKPVLKIGYVDYPPVIMVSANRADSGIGFDLLTAFAAEHGYKAEFKLLDNWNQVTKAIGTGEIDLVPGIQQTPAREKQMLFSQIYVRLPTVFVGHKKMTKKLTDAGITIGVTPGSVLESYLKTAYPRATLVSAPDSLTSLSRVALREIDVNAINSGAAAYYINKALFSEMELKGYTGHEYLLSVGVSHRRADLVPLLNTFIARRADLIKQSADRWQNPPATLPKVTLLLEGVAVGVVLTIIVGWLIYQQRRRTMKLREDLDNTRNLLNKVFDSLPELIFLKDSDGRFVFVNRAFADLYSTTPQKVYGATLEELHWHRPEEAARFRLADRKVIATKRPVTTDDTRTAPDGRLLWFHTTKLPFETSGGALYVLGVATDITERKAYETELRDQRNAAEEANRVKSPFLGVMSHEIRTPMNAIIGLTELLIAGQTNEGQRELLFKVKSSAEALTEILSDILDISQLEAGNLTISTAATDLKQLVTNVFELNRSTAEAKNIEYTLSLDDRLPPQIECDAARLRQVLSNLLTNALKFTETGSVSMYVHIGKQADQKLQFVITDTGIGIPAALHQRIFKPFVQADNSNTRRFGGIGLGLAISQRIVHAMGGSIVVDSMPGRGSTFTVTIPLNLPQATLSQTALPTEGFLGTVLVVEDVEINRIILCQMLGKMGIEVVEATNGQEAIEKFCERLNLVLMDVHMPVVDGLAAAAEIRKKDNDHRIPIVAVTAAVMEEDRQSCLKAGMDDFLAKPVSLASLSAMLKKYLPARNNN